MQMATTTRQFVRPAPLQSSPTSPSIRPGLSPQCVIPTYSLSVHPLLGDVFQQTWRWTCTCWEVCGTLVSIELFSEESLQRLSIMILACHNLQILVDHIVLPEFLDDQEGLPVQPIIPVIWIWAAPIFMLFAIGIIIASPYWWQPHREETIVMVVALVALFLLETLLPVMIFVSTTMLLMRQVDWLSGLGLIVWALLTFSTHFIRCAVYQNLSGQ